VAAKLLAWLGVVVDAGASDLHLLAGHPPIMRLHGDLTELAEPPLDSAETDGLLRSLCPPDSVARLATETDFDFSVELTVGGRPVRFRANLFRAGGQLGACLRVIPSAIPGFHWAGFPTELAERLAMLRDGLVILTGATGSGKTTSLAMIV